MQAAAWTNDTILEFYNSSNPQSSSTSRTSARRWGRYRARAVRAVSLSRVLAESHAVQRAEQLLLKLDIEAGEYHVLPHLLMQGSLCRPDYLLIEWHLNAIPPEERLVGLSLRHTIDSLLRSGCPPRATSSNPQRIFHYEYGPTNEGQVANGLLEEAIRHTWPMPSQGPSVSIQRTSMRPCSASCETCCKKSPPRTL